MSGLNRWQAIARLGAEPELRFTQGGKAVLSLRLACTEKFKSREGEAKEVTTWVGGQIWGPRGEALAKFLKKGALVYVEGALRISSYEDKEGLKKTRTEIEIREIEMMGKASDSPDEGEPARPARTAAPSRRAPSAPVDAGGPPGGVMTDYGGSDDDPPF